MANDTVTAFPNGFLWGAATSAYQVEGSPLADGAGPSIWHRFSHTPGMILGGDTGDVACDHYRRFREDVGLMKELGLRAYRFSVSWSRIFPEGTGAVNQRGLDFYSRLVDLLLENDIQPFVTLYHWDLPAALDDRGGWLNPDIQWWFAEYARCLYRALDGRVRLWATLNEPWVIADGGYLRGALAPGHRSAFEAARVSRNLLLSHAAGIEAYRAEGRHAVGIVVNIEPKHAASQDPADLAAVARADAYMNRQYLDPLLLGRHPEEMAVIFGEAWTPLSDTDLRRVSQKMDLLGMNYYTRSIAGNAAENPPVGDRVARNSRAVYTETGWEVYPDGLSETLMWIRQRYGDLPLYVTENGAAFYDPPTAVELVDDLLRVDYLRRHLLAARQALSAGVDLRGYFVWSLLDNFEWQNGFSKRFGIVHVDYDTQRRTPKRSAQFYRELIRSNGTALDQTLPGRSHR